MKRGAIAMSMAVAMGLAGHGDALAGMTIQRVSVSSTGAQGSGWIYSAAISGNGRYVAFESGAATLVENDTNLQDDVFVHDLQTGITERVSLNSEEQQAMNGSSSRPSVSQDGRYVAFDSNADNLPGDPDTFGDVFVRDRTGGTTELVSVSSSEVKGNSSSGVPSISGDGRYVAFHSSATNFDPLDSSFDQDIYVRDRTGGTTELISVASDDVTKGNGSSSSPSISGDGRYVAFASSASNLVGSDGNGTQDIFVRDRTGGTTQLVSVSSAAEQGNNFSNNPRISADGRYVCFFSYATNLVAGDTNVASDIFVRDLQAGTTERVNLSDGEEEDNGGTGGYGGGISSDGRYVVFPSNGTNLVAGDTNALADIFRRDRVAGATVRVNMSAGGGQMTDGTIYVAPVIAGNGRVMAFVTNSTSLVAGDTNGSDDVFAVTFPAPKFPWIMFNPILTGDGKK